MPTLILLAIPAAFVIVGLYATLSARSDAEGCERLTLTIGFVAGYGAHALAAALI